LKLKPAGKLLVSLLVIGVVAAVLFLVPGIREAVAPGRKTTESRVPVVAPVPDAAGPAIAAASDPGAGCTDKPEVRLFLWAWNAQQGLILATGGKQATAGSLMCENGVNLKLVREDNVDAMQAAMVAFAEAHRAGDPNPAAGTHLVAIMGDGSATFLKGLNDQLTKLGPDYIAVVAGSAGYSRGEDKFMGPKAWKDNPQAARGGVVAGYLRDGDWNIAMKWLADNAIPNNPDDTKYDPNALNWVAASDYIDAAQKYVSGYCTDLVHKQTGKSEKRCVDGVVTWTPGDVTVAQEKGGLVSIVSTREYRSQMPNVLIGNKKWMAANPEIMEGLLRATFAGGDLVKTDEGARQKAAALSALVYGEKDAAYWYKYFTVQQETDKQGLLVELGGSSVNNLADNLQLFGLAPGSADAFAATYTVFGEIVRQQYPELVPALYPVDQVVDLTYLKAVAAHENQAGSPADVATFSPETKVEQVVSRRAWQINFKSGSADFTPDAQAELGQLFDELVVAGGTMVEIHGHTDNQGTVDQNQTLSERRAFAVKQWLEQKSPTNFPQGRVRVFAHGMTEPLVPNDTPDGRSRNRRVEVVLGTSS
jgi:outer membrane protein OmpA-like peptidoglycan-associated protein